MLINALPIKITGSTKRIPAGALSIFSSAGTTFFRVSATFLLLSRSKSIAGLSTGPRGQTGCESKLHRATVKGKLHSRQRRIRENAGYGVGIEDFQTQISARRHDFRCACRLKIDSIARLFPRLDGALGSFASDLISTRDKAATE